MDMASPVREQIYSAIRTFTCATVAEAEAATRAIIRLVDNALPDDGTCNRCGAAPRNRTGLCNSCLEEDFEREGEWLPLRGQLKTAIDVFAEYGIEFRAPWQSDLDDLERERFNALRSAVVAIAASMEGSSK